MRDPGACRGYGLRVFLGFGHEQEPVSGREDEHRRNRDGFVIGPDRWMVTYSGKDIKNNGSIFTLKRCRGLSVRPVVEDGSEK